VDKDRRNAIERATQGARKLIENDFSAQLEGTFDVLRDGTVAPKAGSHLSPRQVFQRDKIVAAIEHKRAAGMSAADAVADYLRDAAFTTLNRFVALKMLEARELVQECITKGEQSAGYREFCGMAAGVALLPESAGYRLYIESLFDELSTEVKVLFNRRDAASVLWLRRSTFEGVLNILNASELAGVWGEDETIGWVYQYWNDPAERKKMRDESAAPRNSRELAVRNQFFTPRYVVEFLTDNTLGRIWYEMTRSETKLKEQCRYLVRRPNEIFLKPGETAPEQPKPDSLSQEDLLKQPVHSPHRPLKDPRTILMLDPACGSMHFGLYAFDLFEVIYHEAWELEVKLGADALICLPGMKSLHGTYADKEAFLKDVPRLIIEHNLHGIDIDPRCAQIAGLSLWLRAQKAWQRLGLRPAERASIKHSNIVCAEPMPGKKELLRDFVGREFPAEERGVFLRLLEAIFDKMQLAGEAGSLLKIEGEIRSAVEEARDAWQKLQNRPGELFSVAELNAISKQPELDTTFDLRLLTSDFFERVEDRIFAALRDYAEQAENGGGFQRRLFAEDAARGFAFIDVCRKRYDVVLMNPPFGEFSKMWREESRKIYPLSSNDILAAFVEGFVSRLAPSGLLGAITSRTCFFLLSFQEWREKVILRTAPPVALVDLGHGVMDAAMVEAAAYVLQKATTETPLFCIRLLSDTDKDAGLRAGVDAVRSHVCARHVFSVMPSDFRKVPGSPFCYWVGSHVRDLFEKLPPFDSHGREAKQGLATGEDFRFVRAWWEVSSGSIVSLPASSTQQAYRSETCGRISWCPFAKGGTFSPFYQDLNLVVRWTDDGNEIRNFANPESGYIFSRYRGAERYFEPGFTYADRASSRFAVRLLPEGAIISVKGSGIYCGSKKDSWSALSILNSGIFSRLMDLLLGTVELAKSYQVNTVGRVPWPTVSNDDAKQLHASALEGWRITFLVDRAEEISHAFHLPALLSFGKKSIASSQSQWSQLISQNAKRLEEIQNRIDLAALAGYGLSETDLEAIEQASSGNHQNEVTPESEDSQPVAVDAVSRAIELPEYAVGSAFGRWDIRYATGEQAAPALPDPFAPLPVCPPGQLQNAQGLPARPEDVPAAYPVRIPWDGILMDDPNHPLDIERRVREVIEIIWGGAATPPPAGGPSAEAIEHEACEILGVKSLRDYFRKPAGFFADHLKRYSKSRRQAPIYWPLSTASGSYTVWLYYHRFSQDTLYNVAAIAKEKLAHEERRFAELVREQGSNPTAAQRKEQAAQETFVIELRGLHEAVAGVARLWRPDLNDGVILNYGPLWQMIAHKPWQKKVKECWDALVKGDYDWSHLAMHLWPERVVPKCTTDRSLAIAHGLADVFWVEDLSQRWRVIGNRTDERDYVTRYWAASALCKILQLARELWEQRYRETGRRDASWWQDVEVGDHDDHPLALLLWPERVCFRAFDDPRIAAAHGFTVPKQTAGLEEDSNRVRCEWVRKMMARYQATPEHASFLSGAFSSLADAGTWRAWWESFDRGEFDHCAVARYQRSAAVSEKCQNNLELAIIHGVQRFFFVDRGAGLSVRLEPAEELSREVTERTSPAVKAALSNLANAPVAGTRSRDRTRGHARPAELGGSR